MITKQQTLKAPLSFSGRGLHTGLNVNMTVLPAAADTGLIFRRVDLEGAPESVNTDPYGAGWMIKVEMSDPAELDNLLDAAGYEAICK